MKGLCHVCLTSNVEIRVQDNLSLCEKCLKKVHGLEKN